MAGPGREIGLVQKPLGKALVVGRREHLEGASRALGVLRKEHHAHAARAEPLHDAKIPVYASGDKCLSPITVHKSFIP